MMRSIRAEADPMGVAIQAYLESSRPAVITVRSDGFDDDVLPVEYLFRSYADMPQLERQALQLCYGSVLDIGAGAGSHALYLQSQPQVTVTTLDVSLLSIQSQRKRGVKKAVCGDVFAWSGESFDTLLMLMNGVGLVGTLAGLVDFLQKAKAWCKPDGQILLDSSDLSYLCRDHVSDVVEPAVSEPYCGELMYQMVYETEQGRLYEGGRFAWLFVDFEQLSALAEANGWVCDCVARGAHYDYVARLSLKA